MVPTSYASPPATHSAQNYLEIHSVKNGTEIAEPFGRLSTTETSMALRSALPILLFLTVSCSGQRPVDVPGFTDAQVPSPILTEPPVSTGPPKCGIAIAVNQCCSRALAYPQTEIDADPCLVPWSQSTRFPSDCPVESLPLCNDDCATNMPPPSLAVVFNGTECEFVDECQNNHDCTMAVDFGECCPYPKALPKPWIAANDCLHATDDPTSSLGSCELPDLCTEVKCAPWNGHTARAECSSTDRSANSFRTCNRVAPCEELTPCSCLQREDCQTETEACFCLGVDLQCPGENWADVACKCSGGKFLGCASIVNDGDDH